MTSYESGHCHYYYAYVMSMRNRSTLSNTHYLPSGYLSFDRDKGIDFTIDDIGGFRFEFNCMIPRSFWRESLGRFFTEDSCVLLVFLWYLNFGHILFHLSCQVHGNGGDRDFLRANVHNLLL